MILYLSKKKQHPQGLSPPDASMQHGQTFPEGRHRGGREGPGGAAAASGSSPRRVGVQGKSHPKIDGWGWP